MPYRIDVRGPAAGASDRLIDLGALDVEVEGGALAALMPDSVPVAAVQAVLAPARPRCSEATGRDDGSVWTLSPRPITVGGLRILPATHPPAPDAIRLQDGPAFGTGLHATTALCLAALDPLLAVAPPLRLLDVGTGSGILALAALRGGVARVTGLDLDAAALAVAAGNARLNDMDARVSLIRGGPAAIGGAWPIVLANIRAAELIELAPLLAQRVASRGALVLSGIPQSAADDVGQAYQRRGMLAPRASARDGWVALTFHPSW